MLDEKIEFVQQFDIRRLDVTTKLSLDEVYKRLGVDQLDPKISFFKNIIDWMAPIKVTEEVLDWCGYNGRNKNNNFKSLLEKNRDIKYKTIDDSLIVVKAIDFEALLMLMRTVRGIEVRKWLVITQQINRKYLEYEKYYEQEKAKKILKELENTNDCLDKGIAPIVQVGPRTVCKKNLIGLFKFDNVKDAKEAIKSTMRMSSFFEDDSNYQDKMNYVNSVQCGWYIIRRQRESFDTGVKACQDKWPSMREIERFENNIVSSVNMGNVIKEYLREKYENSHADIRGNTLIILKGSEYVPSDNDILSIVEKIISDNPAKKLCMKNREFIKTL